MGNFLRWTECDRIDEVYNHKLKEHDKYHVLRELKCDHPAIERASFVGAVIDRDIIEVEVRLEIISKKGERYSKLVTPDEYETANIPEAEEWLKTLSTL